MDHETLYVIAIYQPGWSNNSECMSNVKTWGNMGNHQNNKLLT
jgi:hypothetical protein